MVDPTRRTLWPGQMTTRPLIVQANGTVSTRPRIRSPVLARCPGVAPVWRDSNSNCRVLRSLFLFARHGAGRGHRGRGRLLCRRVLALLRARCVASRVHAPHSPSRPRRSALSCARDTTPHRLIAFRRCGHTQATCPLRTACSALCRSRACRCSAWARSRGTRATRSWTRRCSSELTSLSFFF